MYHPPWSFFFFSRDVIQIVETGDPEDDGSESVLVC